MKKTVLLLVAVVAVHSLSANNIKVQNVNLKARNTTDKYQIIEFDLTWENSWTTNVGPNNHDAAWVFIKYRVLTEQLWYHASINHGAAENKKLVNPKDSVQIKTKDDDGSGRAYGAIIYNQLPEKQRTVDYDDIQLRWEYAVDGVYDGDSVEVYVSAIEMVYVPEGAYSLGGACYTFGHFHKGDDDTKPYQVTSEAAIKKGTGATQLSRRSISTSGSFGTSDIPVDYPKGFKGFYCMKYEVTQAQYVAFLEHLTTDQFANRNPGTIAYGRQGLSGTSPSTISTTRPFIPIAFISLRDVLAYLDWTALRPMTELEYEKACRGPLAPVSNEFAWGTGLYVSSKYTLSSIDLANEGIASNYNSGGIIANANFKETNPSADYGPLRVGIFSAHTDNASRVSAGATYYGIMEMSGNVTEPVITANEAGINFTSTPGNGELLANGNHDVSIWGVTDSDIETLMGLRGGAYDQSFSASGSTSNLSSRYYASIYSWSSSRNLSSLRVAQVDDFMVFGIRGVRSFD